MSHRIDPATRHHREIAAPRAPFAAPSSSTFGRSTRVNAGKFGLAPFRPSYLPLCTRIAPLEEYPDVEVPCRFHLNHPRTRANFAAASAVLSAHLRPMKGGIDIYRQLVPNILICTNIGIFIDRPKVELDGAAKGGRGAAISRWCWVAGSILCDTPLRPAPTDQGVSVSDVEMCLANCCWPNAEQ